MIERVSVVLPYHNREDTLAEAVRSVLDQSYRELTLILVNDGSTDTSRRVACSFADDRIVHVDLPWNHGVCVARNAGIERTTSRLLGFMDSDDVWDATKLDRQLAALRQGQAEYPDIGVVGCGWQYSGYAHQTRVFLPGPFTHDDVLRSVVAGIRTPMLLIDRAVASPTAMFDPHMPALVDQDYVLACTENGCRVIVVPEVLATVHRGRTDHVANPNRAARAYEAMLQKHQPKIVLDSELRSFYHYRACREHLIGGRYQEAKGHLGEALLHDPARRSVHLALGALARHKGLAVAQRLAPIIRGVSK